MDHEIHETSRNSRKPFASFVLFVRFVIQIVRFVIQTPAPSLQLLFLPQVLATLISLSVPPDNRDTTDVHIRHPPQIVGEAVAGVGNLPLAGPSEELEVHLVQHAQP